MLATHKTTTAHNWVTDLLFLTITLGTLYLLWLGAHPLFTPDEGRYSEVAREMIVSGDYITPRLNGVAFLDKPILYYWLQASAIKLFGLREWALRFWPACMGVIGCLITYLSGRLLFNRRTGLLAAIILATNPLYYGAAHYANLDLEVAVLISTTLLFALIAMQATSQQQRTIFILLAYVFCGLAALTKGLIGLAFPIMVIGVWIILLNRWHMILKMRLISGLCIFAIITVPWYLLVQQANPEFFHFFFVTQQFQRFLTQADFNNPSAAWFYVPIVLAGFLPWTIFLIQALSQQIKAVWKSRQQYPTELFLLIWLVIIFAFFSFPKSKTVGYILPIFPALALLTGNYLSQCWEKPNAKGIFYATLSFIVLSIAIVAACLLVPYSKSIEIARDLVPYLTNTAILFSIAGIAACFLLFRNKVVKLFSGLTVVAVIFLLILLASASAMNQKTIKPLIMQLKSIMKPQDEVATYFRFYQDLPLYLERRVTMVADWHAPDIIHNDNWVREMWFGMPFQDTHEWLIQESTFWQRWHSDKRLFVFMNAKDYTEFSKKARSYKLGEYNDVVWVSNRK